MSNISEEAIRARAYALWESGGRSDGDHESHWHEAFKQLTEEEGKPAKKPTKAAKAPQIKVAAAKFDKDAKSAPVAKKRTKTV